MSTWHLRQADSDRDILVIVSSLRVICVSTTYRCCHWRDNRNLGVTESRGGTKGHNWYKSRKNDFGGVDDSDGLKPNRRSIVFIQFKICRDNWGLCTDFAIPIISKLWWSSTNPLPNPFRGQAVHLIYVFASQSTPPFTRVWTLCWRK